MKSTFQFPRDIIFNTSKIVDPASYARANAAASWLYLNGEEFASMEGGMSFDQVAEVVAHSVNVVSDPPRVLDLSLARQHVQALDELPRPTLVTCRAGPRASAVAYLYAGLVAGSEPDDVLESAERDGAPFVGFDDYRAWVAASLIALRKERESR